jgi:hypothetical protein
MQAISSDLTRVKEAATMREWPREMKSTIVGFTRIGDGASPEPFRVPLGTDGSYQFWQELLHFNQELAP